MKTVIVIALGGAIGSVLRYWMSLFTAKFYVGNFPLATFVTNVTGCFAIGLFFGWLDRKQLLDSQLRWFLLTGLCGGFTTFSAFGLENISLWQNGYWSVLFAYIALSVIIGLIAVWLGILCSQ